MLYFIVRPTAGLAYSTVLSDSSWAAAVMLMAIATTIADTKRREHVFMAPSLLKGPSGNNCTILNADASRRASLLVAYIRPVCALLAPRRSGASTPRMAHLFPDGP